MVSSGYIYQRLSRAFEVGRSLSYVDCGADDNCILLTGVARSGTTWLGGILQHATGFRSIFEPYFPLHVRSSGPLGYYPYANESTDWDELERFSDHVISGRIRGRWVDRDNRKCIFKGRIVKEIRLNFILGWLRKHYPRIPIVILVRSPIDVYASWSYLGWLDKKTDEHFSMQRLLFDRRFNTAYPEVIKFWNQQQFSATSFSQFIFDWYLSYAVPMHELSNDDYLLIGYEDLVGDFDNQINRLVRYLELDLDLSDLMSFSKQPSSTDFGNRKASPEDRKQMLIDDLKDSGEWDKADSLLRQLSNRGLAEFILAPALVLRQNDMSSILST